MPDRGRATFLWFGAWVAALVAIRVVVATYDDQLPQPFTVLTDEERNAVLAVQVGIMALSSWPASASRGIAAEDGLDAHGLLRDRGGDGGASRA